MPPGPRPRLGPPYQYLLRIGSSHPQGPLNAAHDANIALQAGALWQLRNRLNLLLWAGHFQFTAEPSAAPRNVYFFNLAANLRVNGTLPSSVRPFVQFGPGYYRAKTGTYGNSAGGNLGAGIEAPITGTTHIELGVDYHILSRKALRFIAVTLGVAFR